MQTILLVMDYLGTVAFAIFGALVAIRKQMDLFGVLVLALISATGGGVLRDLMIGKLPPTALVSPHFAILAAITGGIVFLMMARHPRLPKRIAEAYDVILFSFDTLGLAAFTVDGVVIGITHGYRGHLFLLTFLGVITGVGGGIIRDLLASSTPDILKKDIYAVASILGVLVIEFFFFLGFSEHVSLITGFITIVLLRVLAAKFHWNLPKIDHFE